MSALIPVILGGNLPVSTVVTTSAALAINTYTPVDATAGNLVPTLPVGATAGSAIVVEKRDATTNTVTITGNMRGVAAETIVLRDQYDTVTFFADSSGSWYPQNDRRTNAALDRRSGILAISKVLPRAVPSIVTMVSPPTFPARTTVTGIASPRYWEIVRGVANTGSTPANVGWFSGRVGGPWTRAGTGYPDYDYASAPTGQTGFVTGTQMASIEFMFDGTTFEFEHKGGGQGYRFWADDQIAGVSNPPSDGNLYWQAVTFSSRAIRRIRIDIPAGHRVRGLVTSQSDSVWAAPVSRPRVLLFGDSFAEGTGTTYYYDGYPVLLGVHLGWDMWVNAQGGSSLTSTGNYTGKYAVRIPYYSAMQFDAVILQGSVNDTANAATIAAELNAAVALCRSQWPGTTIIVTSPLMNKGVEGWSTGMRDVRTNLKAAAVAAGCLFVDLMEMPLVNAGVNTTLAASASASASTISSNVAYPIGATIEIGTGLSTAERRVVTNSNSGAPATITIAALTNAHSSGETITQVGPSLLTGTGRVGATTGDGNCDLYVSSDVTHPTTAGHQAFARALADRLVTAASTF